jgi:hypothetical protein
MSLAQERRRELRGQRRVAPAKQGEKTIKLTIYLFTDELVPGMSGCVRKKHARSSGSVMMRANRSHDLKYPGEFLQASIFHSLAGIPRAVAEQLAMHGVTLHEL